MTRCLLDSNVLLALVDSDHLDHEVAHAWLEQEAGGGWASCPITENGFVRTLSQPRYPRPVSPATAMELLVHARTSGRHEFWSCDVSVLDEELVDRTRVHGPKQLTDVYLLALAVGRGGRFVTFDDRVPASAVRRARPEHLVVLGG